MPGLAVPGLQTHNTAQFDELDALDQLQQTTCFSSPYPVVRTNRANYESTTSRAYSSRKPQMDLMSQVTLNRSAKAKKRTRKPLGGAFDGGYQFDWVTANQAAMRFDDEMQRHCKENTQEHNFKRHVFSEFVEARAKYGALEQMGMPKK
jgi:hypothetical protein